MADIDIAKMTKELEAGNGCSIREALLTMPFNESLKIMQKIDEQNKAHRLADSSIEEISFYSSVNSRLEEERGGLSYVKPWAIDPTIVVDVVHRQSFTPPNERVLDPTIVANRMPIPDPKNFERSIKCRDLD
jgi:hypothetical protein